MSRKMDKLYVCCGPLAMVLFLVGMVVAKLVPPPSPRATGAELLAFYTPNRASIFAGLIICFFGAALMGPWIAAVTKQFQRIEGKNSTSAYAMLGLGSLLVLEIILPLILLEVAVFRPERTPAEILLLSDICWIIFVSLVFTFDIQVLVSAVAIFQDRRRPPLFPRWLGTFNVVMAVLTVPGCLVVVHKNGPLAWDGAYTYWTALGLFGLYFAVMTVYLLKAVDRHDVEAPEAATAAAPGREIELDNALV